jgi:hypothetical protein
LNLDLVEDRKRLEELQVWYAQRDATKRKHLLEPDTCAVHCNTLAGGREDVPRGDR